MKQLVLIRHAKAVPYGYDNDFERELTERGISDAGKVALKLKEMGILPDLVVSSPATRAMATARIISEKNGYPLERIEENDELYEGLTTSGLLAMLGFVPDTTNTVFVFGHNPSIYYYAVTLAPDFNEELPTCGTVGIRFHVDSWTKVEVRRGVKWFFLYPKGLS